MNEELLQSKEINSKLWEYCYIVDGEVFPPKAKLTVVDEEFEYEIIMTGEECYNAWLEEQNPKLPEEDEAANKISVLLNELSEGLLEAELRAVESEAIINETSNYVLDLDERLTNLELSK